MFYTMWSLTGGDRLREVVALRELTVITIIRVLLKKKHTKECVRTHRIESQTTNNLFCGLNFFL